MQITCPTCHKASNSKADLSGKRVKCGCGKSFVVPTAEAKAAAGPISSPSPYHAMSDDDWAALAPKPEPVVDHTAQPQKPSNTAGLLARAKTDLGQSSKQASSSAIGQLSSSRWILIGIGAFKLGLSIFWLVIVESYVTGILDKVPEVDGTQLLFILRLFLGIQIGIATSFILMGVFIFLFPLTMTIAALVLFIALEIFNLVIDPLSAFSIIGWIIRLSIFGALVQAINNAAYYKYLKAGTKKTKRK